MFMYCRKFHANFSEVKKQEAMLSVLEKMDIEHSLNFLWKN